MLYTHLLLKIQCLPWTFKAQLNKAIEKGPRGPGQWGVQRGDLKRHLPFLKLQAEKKNNIGEKEG